MPGRSNPKPQQHQSTSSAVAESASGSLSRQAIVIALLVAGGCIYLAWGRGQGLGWQRWLAIATATGLATVPPIARTLEHLLGRWRIPSPAVQKWSPWCVWIGVTGYLILTAFLQNRDLFPKTHDEYSYALGMQMVAHGRLWMPAHPLGEFFQSFYILSKPVYASIYFPGTALMLAPTVWFSLPIWLMPAIIGGTAAALLFLIIADLVDHAAAWIAVLVLISDTWFRTIAMMLMSQGPMLLLGLAVIWAYLRWRRTCSWSWAIAIGVFAGWGAITRPIDAVVFAAPVGVAIMIDLVGKPGRQWATAIALIVAGAVPFLLLQTVFDFGVTRHTLRTPYSLYLEQEQPGASFGFHRFDPQVQGQSPLPQMQKDLEFSKSYFALHQPGNFWKPWLFTQHPAGFGDRPPYIAMIVNTTLPAGVLAVLLPAGLLGIASRRRWALGATFLLFVALYALNPFFLEHYAIILIPAVVLCLLLSIEVCANIWPKCRIQVATALTVLVVATAITGLWEVNHVLVTEAQYQIDDEPLHSAFLQKSHELHGLRAVVLFRWDPSRNWKEEPVNNSQVPWPDDAEIIRAHDLGARDWQIIDYYGKLQPDRTFFLWDQKADKLTKLGTAGDLRTALASGQTIENLLRAGQ